MVAVIILTVAVSHLRFKDRISLPRWLTHMAVDQRPQNLTMRTSPWGCLNVLMKWQLAPP